MSSQFSDLLKKYDVQVPRYTSYPTVPAWSRTPSMTEWIQDIGVSLKEDKSSWSLYIHVPYCETLCTFCGCNNIITKDHTKESSYVDDLLKEFEIYLQQVPELKQRNLKHLHLGGGSPTFLSAKELQRLVSQILSHVKIDPQNFEGSIEVDPRRTTVDQLKVLRDLGFNRVSLGVQDFNEKVQSLINRKQSFEITENLTRAAREMGYASVNFDLIYGLPAQTKELIEQTVEKTLELRPDRLAFYSFALVPWIKPAQRLFTDDDLPAPDKKRELYEMARLKFLQAGYVEVGMDHFALPTDELAHASQKKALHRNFMGYTDQKTDVLLGIGVSSISESHNIFHQNEKLLPKYEASLQQGQIPTTRGHILNARDNQQRKLILELITTSQVNLQKLLPDFQQSEDFIRLLNEFIQDGLVLWEGETLKLTSTGKPFLRNICTLFDDYINKSKSFNSASDLEDSDPSKPNSKPTEKKIFSKSI